MEPIEEKYSEVIKSYKGFNQDMTCKGFQYEEGKEYETEKAESCECGFHACEYPLDVFMYYDPSKSVFHEVEQSGEISREKSDTKVSSTKIKIGASITIAGMVQAAIEYIARRINNEEEAAQNYSTVSATRDYSAAAATGDYSAASATGDHGAAAATGDYSAASITGKCGVSSATGDNSAVSATGIHGAASATGDCSAAAATGDYSAATATWDYSAAAATGYCSAASATGLHGVASATGDRGAAVAEGKYGASVVTGYCGAAAAGNAESIAVAWGPGSKAKGVLGSHLVLADFNWEKEPWTSGTWMLKGAKMVRVDGKNIKPNTWYTITNGIIVEASE